MKRRNLRHLGQNLKAIQYLTLADLHEENQIKSGARGWTGAKHGIKIRHRWEISGPCRQLFAHISLTRTTTSLKPTSSRQTPTTRLLEQAQALVDGHDVEIWNGSRLVARLLHE